MSSFSDSDHHPLREIPGSYGLPFFEPIMDRHNSTVIHTNMSPGPFISSNPRVITLLDRTSFPVLFDNNKVEKFNALDGTFMPSTKFTGGFHVYAYLDTMEPNHELIKDFFLQALARRKDSFLPLF